MEAREQQYWLSIFAYDILSDLLFFLFMVFLGFFEGSILLYEASFRIMHYLLMIMLYFFTKKQPLAKSMIPVLCIVLAGFQSVAKSIFYIQFSYEFEIDRMCFIIHFTILLETPKIVLVKSTKFWVACFLVCPLAVYFY